jgi:hypothetical protein
MCAYSSVQLIGLGHVPSAACQTMSVDRGAVGQRSDAVYTLRQGVIWFYDTRFTLLNLISITAVRAVGFVFPAPIVTIQKLSSFMCSCLVLNLSKSDDKR